jgi:ABC-type antimicrobial peptide transport system permease subunit
VLVPARPDELRGYEGVDATPLALAAFLATIAGATTAHALVSSVRRRRRELALLKTLGFDRRQVRATVAWQATTVAVLALGIGLPVGIIGGRWAWRTLASYLGALAEPRVPMVTVLALVPIILLLANAVAFLPGRRAARLQPAIALRAE